MGFSLDFRGVHRLPRSTGGGERGALEPAKATRTRRAQRRPVAPAVPWSPRSFSERSAGGDPALRIVIGEDGTLFREGLARLLEDAGHEVVAKTVDAPSLIAAVDTTLADLAIVDIRMPPDNTDDGARAARILRANHPELGIVLLSQHMETNHSVELVSQARPRRRRRRPPTRPRSPHLPQPPPHPGRLRGLLTRRARRHPTLRSADSGRAGDFGVGRSVSGRVVVPTTPPSPRPPRGSRGSPRCRAP